MSVGSGSVWVTFVFVLALVRLRVCVGLLLGGLLLALSWAWLAWLGSGSALDWFRVGPVWLGTISGIFFITPPKWSTEKSIKLGYEQRVFEGGRVFL